MPQGVNTWNTGVPTISSPTFARQIEAEKLIDCSALVGAGVPVRLFPRTFVCRSCGTIQSRDSLRQNDIKRGFQCYHDSGPLYPSRWIVYCASGHIDDFDYWALAHGKNACSSRIVLETGASLAETFVSCECGARASMADAYSAKSTRAFCSGVELWSGQHVQCSKRIKVSMRSASDVYFGAVRSAITIEPESDPLVAFAFEELGRAATSIQIDRGKAKDRLRGSQGFELVAEEDIDRVLDAYYKARDEPGQYRDRRYQEFQALARNCGSPEDDLYVERITVEDLADLGIDGIFAVRKLREVRALIGFKRGGMPPDPAFDEIDGPEEELATLGREGLFPAYENRGEGIFISLSPSKLEKWLDRAVVQGRVDQFARAERRWRTQSGASHVEKRRGYYILAHSLAHLLIQQIALVSGYSQSSLRERIYASEDGSASPAVGVLVYTASSDADGSLGGLVAQATDGNIRKLIESAFEAMQLCSSDPICALQRPVGFRKMNAAACHSCLVLPETCCERNNFFLDRIFVVPHTVHDDAAELCYFPN